MEIMERYRNSGCRLQAAGWATHWAASCDSRTRGEEQSYFRFSFVVGHGLMILGQLTSENAHRTGYIPYSLE